MASRGSSAAYVTPVMEGIPLWHERDISHSSMERIALPDAAIATDYLLHLTTGWSTGLVVDADRMRANLESSGGLIYTSAVLLELVEAGLSPRGRVRPRPGVRRWRPGRPAAVPRHAAGACGGRRRSTLDEARLDEVCARSATSPASARSSTASPRCARRPGR